MFFRVLFESLVRRRERKLVAVAAIWIGITLIAAFLTVSLTVGDRLNQEMQSFGANIRVDPIAAAIPVRVGGLELAHVTSRAYLDESGVLKLKKEIFWRNNILGIIPRLTVQTHLEGKPVQLVGLWLDHTIALPDEGSFRTGARLVYKDWVVEGRWPRTPDECLAGRNLARALHIHQGSSLTVGTGVRCAPLRVCGIVTTAVPEDAALIAPLSTVQQISGLRGKLSRVDVSALTTPEDKLAKKYHENPATLTPAEYERWSCVAYPGCIALNVQNVFPNSVASVIRRVSDTQGTLLKRIQALMTTLAILTVLASTLSVLGVLASTVLERRQEAALLQAIGALRRSVLALFVSEAAILGLAGGVLAAFTGPLLGAWLIRLVFDTAGTPPPILTFLAPVLGVVVAVGASIWPVMSVVRQSTATLLHGG